MNQTRTVALLDVSQKFFDLVKEKLLAADYQHALIRDPNDHDKITDIDMHGVVLSVEKSDPKPEGQYVVFDGPPSHESGRFVEVENQDGQSVGLGEKTWKERADGLWELGPFQKVESSRKVLRELGDCEAHIVLKFGGVEQVYDFDKIEVSESLDWETDNVGRSVTTGDQRLQLNGSLGPERRRELAAKLNNRSP